MGIGQLLTMPIFFASNAIYPISLMRALMLRQGSSDYGLPLDFSVLFLTTMLLVTIAARTYGRMGY